MASGNLTQRSDSTHATYARWVRFRELGIVVVLAVVFFGVTLAEPRFISPFNLRTIILYVPLIVVVALGQLMVIVSRNIDISVGSILGFSAIAVGMIFVKYPGFPIILAFVVGPLIGAVLGFVNGALVAWLRLPAIIVTLGTLSVYRGLIFIVSGGRQVDPNHIPVALIRLSQAHASPIGVPWIVVFAAVAAAAVWYFLRYSYTGRQIYAVGSNPTAARLRGIAVDRVTVLVFTLTGAACGLAGIMYASRHGYVNPGDTGIGFELTVIAATVIGGTSVSGGTGTVLGTVLGSLLLGVLNVAIIILGVSAFWQLATYGLCILLAVSVDTVIQRQLKRAMMGGAHR